VRNFFKLSAAIHELSTVNYILDNSRPDREYFWNKSSNRQAIYRTFFMGLKQQQLLLLLLLLQLQLQLQLRQQLRQPMTHKLSVESADFNV